MIWKTAALVLALLVVGCSVRTGSRPSTGSGLSRSNSYATGIETSILEDGTVSVRDTHGMYAMEFPENWVVGGFDESFVPIVESYGEINWAVQELFQQLYQGDPSVRIFALDTSPAHLTKNSMAVIHIGMPGNEAYQQATLDGILAEYLAYLQTSGEKIIVTQTLLGKSDDGIPFAIILTCSNNQVSKPVYGASVLIKTDTTYVELLYTTLDPGISIPEELMPILFSLTTFVE